MKKIKARQPNLSLPIDTQLQECLRQDSRDEHLSCADIVRRILRRHYGLMRQTTNESRVTA